VNTYEITAPDGRKFRVTGPGTREEALAQVQASYKPRGPVQQIDVDPTKGMSTSDKFFAGVGKGMTDVVRGVGQAIGLVDQSEIDESKKRDAALVNTTAGTVGNIAGTVAATAPTMLIPGANTVAGSAAIGAATGALAPVASDESRGMNTVLGGAGGAVGAAVGKVLPRVAAPITPSEPVKKLMAEGVIPTPGQAVSGGKIGKYVNKVEQQLESLPGVGWFISNARGRAVKEMDEAAIRKALPAGTVEQIKAGREGIERAGAIIDNAYDAAYAAIRKSVKGDEAFSTALGKIPKAEGIDLPPSLQDRFESLLKDRVGARLENGANAETVREIHNSLGALARRYRSSADPDQRALGLAFAEAKKEFRDMVSRQSGGEFKQALDALDNKYSALLAVEKASGYTGSKEGIFSAEALQRASKKSSGEMKSFAQNAADVLGRTVPDSGTAGRVLLPLGVAGGNEYLGGPDWVTGAALGAAAGAPLYSRMGARYMLGDIAGQRATSDAIKRLSPFFALTGRTAGQ
jgi:hypothetical protein